MLPTFIVIGTMKAGNTALRTYLHAHPAVYLAPKEPSFFAFRWDKGREWYESLFEGASSEQRRGDISPEYSQYAGDVAGRMSSVVPNARLIYLLRDPIARIQAHYLHAVATGKERRPIDRALAEAPWYVTISKYSLWIKHFLEHFERSQLLLLTSEDLRDKRGETLDAVLEHIGLQPGWRPPNIDAEPHRTADKRVRRRGAGLASRLPGARVLAGTRVLTRAVDVDAAALTPDLEAKLRDDLSEDIAELRNYLSPDFHCWGLA